MNQKEREHLSETGHTLLLLLASLIWGAAFVAQSIGAEYAGAYTFLACRSWIAAVFICYRLFSEQTEISYSRQNEYIRR